MFVHDYTLACIKSKLPKSYGSQDLIECPNSLFKVIESQNFAIRLVDATYFAAKRKRLVIKFKNEHSFLIGKNSNFRYK